MQRNSYIMSALIDGAGFSLYQVDTMTNDDVFKALLEWEGIVSYDSWIKRRVEDIYGVELRNK